MALLAGKARPDGLFNRLVLFSHPISFAKRNGDVSPKKRRGTFAKPSPAPPPENQVLRFIPGNGPMGPWTVFRCRWVGGHPPRAGSLPSQRQRKWLLEPIRRIPRQDRCGLTPGVRGGVGEPPCVSFSHFFTKKWEKRKGRRDDFP